MSRRVVHYDEIPEGALVRCVGIEYMGNFRKDSGAMLCGGTYQAQFGARWEVNWTENSTIKRGNQCDLTGGVNDPCLVVELSENDPPLDAPCSWVDDEGEIHAYEDHGLTVRDIMARGQL